jgi:hypothetical protein
VDIETGVVDVLLKILFFEEFHLLFDESVKLSLELFFLVFSIETIMINLFIILLDSHSKYSLLKLLSK